MDLKYHLYGYFEKGVDWGALLYLIGIYPAVNIVFLNFFPYKKNGRSKAVYIFGWIIFAIVFELLFLWSGTFYYNGWKTWYSALIYPFLYVALVSFHKYTRFLIKRHVNK